MTSRIIYHDFRSPDEVSIPSTAVVLTSPVLTKGRRLLKTAARVHTAVNAACIFLCGACIGVSLFIFIMLGVG